MQTRRTVPLVLTLAVLSGCGAIINGTRQDINVRSDPAGATVATAEGRSSLTTPTTLKLERKRSYVLTFRAAGYQPATFNVDNHLSGGVLAADILLTGLIGVIVDGSTGAWYNLKPDSASVTLRREADGAGPDEIHVQLSNAHSGKIGVQSDAPGVMVEVKARK